MALAAGLTKDDLLRSDHITRVGSDLYARVGTPAPAAAKAIALARTFPRTWVSHNSAAVIRGIKTGESSGLPQLTAEAGSMRIRRRGVECAVDRFRQRGVDRLYLPDYQSPGGTDFFRVSKPERIWAELADHNSLQRAVAFGDQLVRIPRPSFENRTKPFCTVDELLGFITEVAEEVSARKPRGLSQDEWRFLRQTLLNLQQYASLIRVGADSPPETHLRLALLNAGLPEPSLQYPVEVDGRIITVIDIAFPEAKIALHYDGAPHLTPESMARDIARDNLLVSLGWINIRAGRADYRQGFQSQIAQVRAVLSSRPRT